MIPVTAPVVALIVATEVVDEVQDPPVKEEDKVGVEPMQIAVVPNKFPVVGAAVIVTTALVETFEHPPVPITE